MTIEKRKGRTTKRNEKNYRKIIEEQNRMEEIDKKKKPTTPKISSANATRVEKQEQEKRRTASKWVWMREPKVYNNSHFVCNNT